jgi:uncharacterized Fe-S cluster-containing radical SAM superfamily enzyme
LQQTVKFNVPLDWFQEEVQLKTITVEAQLDSSFEEVTEEAPLAEVIEPSSDHANVSITEQQLKTDTLAEKRHKKTKYVHLYFFPCDVKNTNMQFLL